MSHLPKTLATELVVACGILGRVPSKTALLAIDNVSERGAEQALSYIGSLEGSRLSTSLWNVGWTIQKQLGLDATKRVYWTGSERRHAVHVAAEDLRVHLNSGLNPTEVSVKVNSNVIHNRSIEWLRLLLEGEDSDLRARGENWFTRYAPWEQNNYFCAVGGPGFTGCQTAEEWYYLRTNYEQKQAFAKHCAGLRKDATATAAYTEFVLAVTKRAAEALNQSLSHRIKAKVPLELVFRKLLRLDTHSYIVCGLENTIPFAALVPSISRFSEEFEVLSLTAKERNGGQPMVELVFKLRRRSEPTKLIDVRLHTELRWSHGKFSGSPEGKIYKNFKYLELPWLVHWPIEQRARPKV